MQGRSDCNQEDGQNGGVSQGLWALSVAHSPTDKDEQGVQRRPANCPCSDRSQSVMKGDKDISDNGINTRVNIITCLRINFLTGRSCEALGEGM